MPWVSMPIAPWLMSSLKGLPGIGVVRGLRRFAQLPATAKTMEVEALFLLLCARLALLLLPFQTVMRWLGNSLPADAPSPELSMTSPGSAEAEAVRTVGSLISDTARRFSLNCLPQAIAARIMLKRRGIPSVLHFGVRSAVERNSKLFGSPPAKPRLEAHAWLEAASTTVTGAFEPGYYDEIARVV